MSEIFNGLSMKELVLWTRPQATGIVVGTIAVWLFLMGYMEYTLLTLVCRIFQVGAAAWFIASKLNKAPQVTRSDLQDAMTKALNAAEPIVVNVLGLLVDIISWQDTMITGKVLVGSIAVSFVGSFFSDLTLVFLVTLGVFAGPITYVQNKDVIDTQIKNVTPIINNAISKIPMLKAAGGGSSSTDSRKKSE